MAKIRPDSAIASLTEEQRNQLYDWLLSHSYPDVQDLASKPESDGGFGIKFHRTTLIRFFDKEREERQARELAELAAQSDIADMPDKIGLLIQAASTRFAQATYELAKAANQPADYDRLDRALHHMHLIRVKREEVANERTRIEEQKRQWEFDISREVMKNYLEYDRIHQQQGVDEPEKIWQAREIAFGKDPADRTAGILPAPAPSVPSVESEQSLVVHTDSVPASPARTPQSSPLPALDGGQTQSDTKRHDLPENPPLAPGENSESLKSPPSAVTSDNSTISGQTHSDTKRHDLEGKLSTPQNQTSAL